MSSCLRWFVPCLLLACQSEKGITTFNNGPEANITSHTDGDEVFEGETVTFRGAVSDPDDGPDNLLASWYIGTDEACAEAAPDTSGVTTCDIIIGPDDTQVTLEVHDSGNSSAIDTVTFSVIATESPNVTITSPTSDGVYYSDQKITFEGIVSDNEDLSTDLVVSWSSDLEGELKVDAEPNDDGDVSGFGYLTTGEHAIELTATDTSGKAGSDNVIIQVGPPNSAPSCSITSPDTDSADESGTLVVFEGQVSDVDVPANWLTVTWSSDKDGDLGKSTPNSKGSVAFPYSDLSINTHVVTLTVTDEVGADCSAYIIYTVGTAPTLEIISPENGVWYNEGDLVTFEVFVSDNEDNPTDLDISWDLDGVVSDTPNADSNGTALWVDAGLAGGMHQLQVTVTDTDELFTTGLVVFYQNGDGECGGEAYEDGCGVCDSDPTNDCVQDCAGVWDGGAYEDQCGVCDDDASNDCVQDCAGEWGGSADEDECGECGGDGSSCNECPNIGSPIVYSNSCGSFITEGYACWWIEAFGIDDCSGCEDAGYCDSCPETACGQSLALETQSCEELTATGVDCTICELHGYCSDVTVTCDTTACGLNAGMGYDCDTNATVQDCYVCELEGECEGEANTQECEPGWEAFQDSCYQYQPQHTSWDDAQAHCETMDAHLVAVSSQVENWFVFILTGGDIFQPIAGEHGWIGLNGPSSTWVNGEPLNYTSWSPGEPNTNWEGCVISETTTTIATWNDVPCSNNYPSVCEK